MALDFKDGTMRPRKIMRPVKARPALQPAPEPVQEVIEVLVDPTPVAEPIVEVLEFKEVAEIPAPVEEKPKKRKKKNKEL